MNGVGATRAPLFVRIFLFMLVAVIGVQVLNFALFLVVPPPQGRISSVAEVAAALRTGTDNGGTLILSTAATTPDAPSQGPMVELLAKRIGVPVQRVSLELEERMPFRPPPPQPPRMQERRPEILFGHFTAALRLDDGNWRVARPKLPQGLRHWQWMALLWLLGATLVVAPFAWLLARRVAAPIGLFASAARRLGRDPTAPPLTVDGSPEVAAAAAAFNEMQARLRRYVNDRTTVVAAIAHDLRTPLMRLALRLEHAPEALRQETAADVAEMNEMITVALAFVRNIDRPLNRKRLSLRSLVESVAEERQDIGFDVKVEPGVDLIAEVDLVAIKALIGNLVDNALKYAGTATLRLSSNERQAVIEVCDEGPGIAAGELEHVFEPFYRIEQSRNRTTGGTGLGLSSARSVARAHGGDVELINREAGGLLARATISLR